MFDESSAGAHRPANKAIDLTPRLCRGSLPLVGASHRRHVMLATALRTFVNLQQGTRPIESMPRGIQLSLLGVAAAGITSALNRPARFRVMALF